MRQLFSIGAFALFSVVVIIALIGGVTFLAFRVISQTFSEQVETAELQLITALAQQGQAAMTNLEANINNLAVQEDIRATSATKEDEAIQLLEERAKSLPEGSVISITRFDFRGDPVYAWPRELNEEIQTLENAQGYIFRIPNSLLEKTSRGQSAVSEIKTEIYRLPHRDGGAIMTLIAPVASVNLRTGYLVYQLDLPSYFSNIYSFVDLGISGQMWVLDDVGIERYAARPSPDLRTVTSIYPHSRLRALPRPDIYRYESEGEARQAAIATFPALNLRFVIFISRLETEAQAGLAENLLSIFGFSVTAVLVVLVVASIFGLQIRRSNQERQQEAQRRQAARTLLEVSRALNSSLELDKVLNQILGELQNLVPHDTASILLMEGQDLRVAAVRGFDGTELGSKFKLDQARAARQVISTGQPLVINRTSKHELWTETIEGQRIASWVGIPLRIRERLAGVLNINSFEENHFVADDIDMAAGFADQASVALQNAQLHELELKQYTQELEIARGIQTSLLPQEAPEIPALEFASHSLPASQVSGDYYQYLPMMDGKIAIAIGDVQGKGIPAALMMAVITTAMRDEVVRFPKPHELLQALNKRLLTRMQQNHMNSALIVATYDPRSYQLEMANGGMVQPYLRLADSEAFEFVAVGGYPLGISETIRYTPKTIDFKVGSVLVMVSDGVIEAQNTEGEFFGFDRLEDLLNTMPNDLDAENIKVRILEAVKVHIGEDAPPQDDTTIIVLRAIEALVEPDISLIDTQPLAVKSAEAAPAATFQLELEDQIVDARISLAPHSNQHLNLELYLPSQLGYEKIARGTAAALALEIGFDADRVEDLKTAVAEACMNAIEHGNSENLNQHVKVLMCVSRESLEVRVTDRGDSRLPKELPPPGMGDMRGWGLFFMQQLMDQFEIIHLPDGGNQVRLLIHRQNENSLESAPNLADNGSSSKTDVALAQGQPTDSSD